jgi:hypothetical protein
LPHTQSLEYSPRVDRIDECERTLRIEEEERERRENAALTKTTTDTLELKYCTVLDTYKRI